MEKVNLFEKFAAFSDYYNPKIVGELNNQQVKLAKLKSASYGINMILKMNYFWL